MKLRLNGIIVDCIIGELPEERNRLQRLEIDVEIEVLEKAMQTDELSDTVDYAKLTEEIRTVIVAAKCKMIERVAGLTVEICQRYSTEGMVTVRKAGAISGLKSAEVVFSWGKKP